MIKTWFLTLTLIAGAVVFAGGPASAQTTTTSTGAYGYQCFSTMDGVQHCSCSSFDTSDDGYAWMFTQLANAQANASGQGNAYAWGHDDDGNNSSVAMSSHSDVVVQTQDPNCVQ